MKNDYVNFPFALLILLTVFFAGAATAQNRQKQPVNRQKTVPRRKASGLKPMLKCSTLSADSNEPGFLVGASRLSKADRKRLENDYGKLIIPEGETERAREIRKKAQSFRQRQLDEIAKIYKTWKQMYPNATEEEIKSRLERQQSVVDYFNNGVNKERLAKKSWDWREQGIRVAPVMQQGIGCNTCWAFVAASAAAASLQKHVMDQGNSLSIQDVGTGELRQWVGALRYFDDPSPFVQDLLNCMPIPEKNICRSGWHGRAFDFMVNGNGMPMSFADGYVGTDQRTGNQITYRREEYQAGQKFTCRPNNGFLKAVSWDYVSSPPDVPPTVEQLKTALIEHGPLAAPIIYDDCLSIYRGGIFNENRSGKINHVVLLLGWDDAKSAWLIMNSWGEDWGEKGFGWIRYASNRFGSFAAWIDAEDNVWNKR
jgi:hypothetical protein